MHLLKQHAGSPVINRAPSVAKINGEVPTGKISSVAWFNSKPYQLRMKVQLVIKMLIISCGLLNFIFRGYVQ